MKLFASPVQYFRPVECGYARALAPMVAACVLAAATGGHMSKVSCDVPVAVYGVIAIFEIAFAVLVAGIVFAVFCVVAALTGDVEQSRGRLVKCLGLSYWIFIPVGAATLASPARGRSCDRHGFHPQLPFLQRHAPRLYPCQYSAGRRRAGPAPSGSRWPPRRSSTACRRRRRFPLLVTADFETGAGFRMAGATNFPWAMAFGAAGDRRSTAQTPGAGASPRLVDGRDGFRTA